MSHPSKSESELEEESEIGSDSEHGSSTSHPSKNQNKKSVHSKTSVKVPQRRQRSRCELNLGTVVKEFMDACGKAKACPPPLVNNHKNVDVFVKAVIKYAAEVPAEYWKYLFSPQASGERNIVVQDDGQFPKNYVFAGKSNGISEISESQVNFYRIIHFCKEEDKSSWKTQRPSYLANAFQRHVENAGSNKGSEFGRTVCGLLIKLFDCRYNETVPPMAKTRRVFMVDCEKMFLGYEALKRELLTTQGFNVWAQKLVLPENLLEMFPFALSEESSDAERMEEYITDEETEPTEITQAHGNAKKVPVFKANREIPVSTEEALRQAEEDLEHELSKKINFEKQAEQCEVKAESLRTRIELLRKQLSRERTDERVVNAIADTMGIDEYLQSGEEVPVVYLEVKSQWKKTKLPWDAFWSLVKTKLDTVTSELDQLIQGTSQTSPDTEGNQLESSNGPVVDEIPDFSEEVSVSGSVSEDIFLPSIAPTGVSLASSEHDQEPESDSGRIETLRTTRGPEFEVDKEQPVELEDLRSNSGHSLIMVPTGVQRALASAQHVRKPEAHTSRGLKRKIAEDKKSAQSKNTVTPKKHDGATKDSADSPKPSVPHKSNQVEEDNVEKSKRRRKTELEKLNDLNDILSLSVVERN